jgi:hypothetical protein
VQKLKRKDLKMGETYYWAPSKKWFSGDPTILRRKITPVHLLPVVETFDGERIDANEGRYSLGPGLLVNFYSENGTEIIADGVVQVMDIRGPWDQTLSLVQAREAEFAQPSSQHQAQKVLHRLQRAGITGATLSPDGMIVMKTSDVKLLLDRKDAHHV